MNYFQKSILLVFICLIGVGVGFLFFIQQDRNQSSAPAVLNTAQQTKQNESFVTFNIFKNMEQERARLVAMGATETDPTILLYSKVIQERVFPFSGSQTAMSLKEQGFGVLESMLRDIKNQKEQNQLSESAQRYFAEFGPYGGTSADEGFTIVQRDGIYPFRQYIFSPNGKGVCAGRASIIDGAIFPDGEIQLRGAACVSVKDASVDIDLKTKFGELWDSKIFKRE